MNLTFLKGQKGFSLLEVLVALALMALIFAFVSFGGAGPRQQLDSALENIERSLRFSSDESTIRNTVIRVHFFLDKNPAEFAVEYGPADSFMLPPTTEESAVKSLAEEEKSQKEQKKRDQGFARISEFQEKNAVIPDDVKLIGIASANQKNLTTEGQPSLYVFPTGEKESALIIVANSLEVAALSVDGFSGEMSRVYRKIEGVNNDNLNETQQKIAIDLLKEWQKQ